MTAARRQIFLFAAAAVFSFFSSAAGFHFFCLPRFGSAFPLRSCRRRFMVIAAGTGTGPALPAAIAFSADKVAVNMTQSDKEEYDNHRENYPCENITKGHDVSFPRHILSSESQHPPHLVHDEGYDPGDDKLTNGGKEHPLPAARFFLDRPQGRHARRVELTENHESQG